MKEKVTLFTIVLVVLFTGTLLKAQSFTFQTQSNSKIAVINSEILFDFPVVNKSSVPINVTIIRRSENIPSTWQGTMCFGINCFPPFVDSVESEQILPNDTAEYSYHFFTDNITANGTVTLLARNSRNPSDTIVVTLSAQTSTTGINSISESVNSYSLEQNYPNPFNPSTRISFSIPQRDYVTLKVYDLMGRETASLLNQQMDKGNHTITFTSEGLASGTYLYKLTAGSYTSIKKMIILK